MVRRTVLAAVATLATGVAQANDINALLATPLPPGPGAYIPPGSTLNAPVIVPVGTRCGQNLFEITPAGTNNETFTTKAPSSYVNTCPFCPEHVGWLSVEFLYWATQGPSAPPLVTTGPAILGPTAAGYVGQSTTQDLLGGHAGLNNLRPGFRVTGGLFIDQANEWAVSHQIISLGSRSERLVGGSDGANLVNLPQLGPPQTPIYVGYPGFTKGTVTASNQTSFFSGDTNLRRVLQDPSGVRLDLFAGYRFLQVGDSISDSFDVVSATTPGPVSPRLMGEDSVRTRNQFHGGEVGFSFSKRTGKLVFEVQSSLAMGVTVCDMDQSRTRSVFLGPIGAPVVQTAASNTSDYFAVVPEVGLKLGWQPVEHVRVTAGYDFIYWSRVRRAQEMYTLGPVLNSGTTDFWAQGFTLGAEVRY